MPRSLDTFRRALAVILLLAGSSLSVQAKAQTTPLSGIQQVAAGGWHSCALTNGGGVKCWGMNDAGQLGDNSQTRRRTPVDVSGLNTGVVAITAGGTHTCALLSSGAVMCWGANDRGQLGDNSHTYRLMPVMVVGLSGVTAIAAGFLHTCAVLSGGGVRCWGDNYWGQVGDNSRTSRLTPVSVEGLTGVAAIAPGTYHTCALTSNGGVKCWGENGYGQLGDNSITARLTPGNVSGLTSGVTAIASGDRHICAVLSGGGMKCWGSNNQGQLGNGSPFNSVTPVDVVGVTGLSAVAAGSMHTCALLTGGAVKCWGENGDGQLGDNSRTSRWTPINVSGLIGVPATAAGGSHTCALLSGGGAKCWGQNLYGQIGDNTNTQRLTPVAVLGGSGALTDDHGNSTATATLIPPNSSTAGRIEIAGDNDFFRIVLSQAGVLTVRTTGNTDTYGHFLDSAGAEITHNDDANAPNFSITWQLAAGTYYVRVRHYSNAGTGAYTLLSEFVPSPPDDHGNSPAAATFIQPNGTTAGRIAVPGDIDYFRVVLPEAGTLTAFTTGSTDTYGYLKDSAGQIIAEDDDQGELTNFRLSRFLNAGTYFIGVKHYWSSGLGDYQLLASFVPASAGAQQSKVVLLLHGLNSGPDTWDSFARARWAGICPIIRDGVLEAVIGNRADADGIYCYRVRFGTQDSRGTAGLLNTRCSDTTVGCSGDYTRIFTNTGTGDLGEEVRQAVGRVISDQKNRLGQSVDVRVALLGHSRGGLAARAFLQRPQPGTEHTAISALLTTGTPHKGSPIGRLYHYLGEYCDANLSVACTTDRTLALSTSPAIDLRRPTISYLRPESADIQALEQTESRLGSLKTVTQTYQGKAIGHLAFSLYVWEIPGRWDNNVFSEASMNFALCGNYSTAPCNKNPAHSDFQGDGIVPYRSQRGLTDRAGLAHPTDPTGTVFHVGETDRNSDLNKLIKEVRW